MLNNKNIIVTGVSKGLGLETTRLLLKNGATIYGISRSRTLELEQLLLEYSTQFRWIGYDLTDVENINQTIFKEFIGKGVAIHGLVNNAAIAYDDIVTNINAPQLEKMFRANVYSPMLLTKFSIRNMLLYKVKGSIVHLSSISVHTGYKGLAMYASTKGALEAFSKNTAREWGEIGVRSNCLVAGFMETEMSASLRDDQKNRIYNRTSLKQPTSLNSVSETIQFLLSDAASSITGQNIFVDSGTI